MSGDSWNSIMKEVSLCTHWRLKPMKIVFQNVSDEFIPYLGRSENGGQSPLCIILILFTSRFLFAEYSNKPYRKVLNTKSYRKNPIFYKSRKTRSKNVSDYDLGFLSSTRALQCYVCSGGSVCDEKSFGSPITAPVGSSCYVSTIRFILEFQRGLVNRFESVFDGVVDGNKYNIMLDCRLFRWIWPVPWI